MIRKTSTKLSLVLGAFTLGAVIGLITLQQETTSPARIAAIEPAATDEPAAFVPAPARPLFKKDESDQAVTIIADTPETNGVDGAPEILKTELGFAVSPMCLDYFFSGEKKSDAIDVTTCEKISGYKNIQTGIDQGRYRSLYEFPSEPDMPAETGFVSYDLLGDVPSGTAVQVYTEAGGTGRFSSIAVVKLSGNMLSQVETLAGGDRCNGGITEAHVEKGKIIYTANVTPGDFPVLAWGEDKGISAYEDLEASAMSCFALATYTDGILSKIALVPAALDNAGEWSEQYKYQKCFNQHFRKQIESGKKEMDLPSFKSFMNDFLSNCKK